MSTSSDCMKFRFKDIDEVKRALAISLAENWNGTFFPSQLHEIIVRGGDVSRAEYIPFIWKIHKIRGTILQRVIPDTWLTKPYEPRMPANAKLP